MEQNFSNQNLDNWNLGEQAFGNQNMGNPVGQVPQIQPKPTMPIIDHQENLLYLSLKISI